MSVESMKQVTPEEWAKILPDLEAKLKLKRKKNEGLNDYAERLARKGNEISDDAWEDLAELSQLWINGMLVDEPPRPLPEGEEEPDGAPDAQEAKSNGAAEPPKAAAKKAAAKKPAAKKAAPASEAGSSGGRGRPSRHPLEAKVKILVSPNPHREGTKSHGYYGVYEKGVKRKSGITLAQVLEAGVPRAEVNWHEDRGIIAFEH